MDVNTDRDAGYRNTQVWQPGSQPGCGEILVDVQDKAKFYKEYVELLTRPTPGAKNSAAK
jgi:hypothetical protein